MSTKARSLADLGDDITPDGLGTAAFLDSDGFGSAAFREPGSAAGDLVAFDSDGSGNASLNTPNITDSDGVTVQTTYVTNGSAKAWVNFNGTGTIAARDSLNVSSLTDNGTGNYTVNFSSSFDNANYSTPAAASRSATQLLGALNIYANGTLVATSNYTIYTYNFSGSLDDYPAITAASFGDLA